METRVQLQVFILFSLFLGTYGLQCYVCESLSGDETSCATEDNPGNMTTCPDDRSQGCFLTQTSSASGTIDIRGCTDVTDEEQYKCVEHLAGETKYTSCLCHGDGCNLNFDSAAGEKLKCYTCNALNNVTLCGPEYPGELKECPFSKRRGCTISVAMDGKGGKVYDRQCSELTDPSRYTCQNIEHAGEGLHYCNCHGEGCNKDFDTAARPPTPDNAAVGIKNSVIVIFLAFTLSFNN